MEEKALKLWCDILKDSPYELHFVTAAPVRWTTSSAAKA
jgi:hypothetical protein